MNVYQRCKQEVLQCARKLAARGYLIGTGGNVSIRVQETDVIAVTPSSREYETLAESDICILDFGMNVLEGDLRPSIETGMHIAIYQNRPDVNAVIHSHQVFATIFSLIGHPIPALFDEQVVNLGNIVDIVPYAVSGSPELVKNVTEKLANQCLSYIIQNHGVLCLGRDIGKAFNNVELLEKNAKIYFYAMLTGKEISLLPRSTETALFELLRRQQEKQPSGEIFEA